MSNQELEQFIIEGSQGSQEARDKFYPLLLRSRLIFPVRSEIPSGSRRFTIPGQPDFTWAVSVVNGNPTIPAFTSKEKLQQFFAKISGWENRSVEDDVVKLMQNLVESNLTLSLNPLDQYGLSLSSAVMKKLIS